MTDLSKQAKILLAADILTTNGRTPFHVDALAVESWRAYPGSFGLHGYEHPNNNAVISAVVGKKGMAGRGLLRKVEQNTYEMTQLGRENVVAIKAGKASETSSSGKYKVRNRDRKEELSLEPRNGLFVDELMKTTAYRLNLLDGRVEICCRDAWEFFGGHSVADLQTKLSVIVESESPQAGVARALRHLADYLVTRFAKQLDAGRKA